jgi:hypothetical protein
MAAKISMAARAKVTAAIRERYAASGKLAKGVERGMGRSRLPAALLPPGPIIEQVQIGDGGVAAIA